MKKSTFNIPQMDCSAEEQMIRMKLEGIEEVQSLNFNIPNRTLEVYHKNSHNEIEQALDPLNLGSKLDSTEEATEVSFSNEKKQKKILWWVLGINLSFFIIEMTGGWIVNSMGLIADSLDMLADASVYGLSLFAVGSAVARKKKVAKISGYLQMGLASLGFLEVLRRFFGVGDMPVFQWMIIIASIALAGNMATLWLINKANSQEAHMKASSIFTSNDIIVNGGVIVAGILVFIFDSRWPDLLIGAIVFSFVMRGAIRILNLSK
ncbi:cation transporter [Fodinibius sediminis]|uniref:Heavy-metal-associated domain-containing protein n=1 Tax=Fodinibius sediminis TaxID=1214077 RepID=A0A521EFN3_9BACT|nr:cation transporter [Fodinibius sediminis]SMO82709.1 Heavy-metal-associated domain-containing protein [Fodinibius sediminis]